MSTSAERATVDSRPLKCSPLHGHLQSKSYHDESENAAVQVKSHDVQFGARPPFKTLNSRLVLPFDNNVSTACGNLIRLQ